MTNTPQPAHTASEKRHWVRITRCCNNDCCFCLDSDLHDGTILSVDEVVRDLKKGIEEGAGRAVISGGDPSVHPGFIEIIRAARTLGYGWVQLITNGRVFADPDVLRRAMDAGLNEVTLSIHGHTAELYERQTRVPGSFAQAMAALENALKTQALVVSVDIVVSGMNAAHLPEMLIAFIRLGVREFDLLYPIPFGSAWENRDQVLCELEPHLPKLRKAFALSASPELHIWTNRFPPALLEQFEHMIQSPEKLHDEVYGRKDMFEALIRDGAIPDCHGERCGFCAMKDFCALLEQVSGVRRARTPAPLMVCDGDASELREVDPALVSHLYIDGGGLDSHPLVRDITDGGKDVIRIVRSPADPVLQTPGLESGIEIEINREIAPAFMSGGLDPALQGGAALVFLPYITIENCRDRSLSLRRMFEAFASRGAAMPRVVNVPPCISKTREFIPLQRFPIRAWPHSKDWALERFTDYFIQFGYFAHSLRCRSCWFFTQCPGLHINTIRAFGFREIPGPVVNE